MTVEGGRVAENNNAKLIKYNTNIKTKNNDDKMKKNLKKKKNHPKKRRRDETETRTIDARGNETPVVV